MNEETKEPEIIWDTIQGPIRELIIKSNDGEALTYKNAMVTVNGKVLPYVTKVLVTSDVVHAELIVEVEHAPVDDKGKIRMAGFKIFTETIRNWISSMGDDV